MPVDTDNRTEVLRQQRDLGRDIKQVAVAHDLRLADIGAELGLDASAFSAVINGRRVWQAGVDDLNTRLAQAVEAVKVRAA